MAALRAGAMRVGVPAALRGTAVEAAIAATPSARRGVVWLGATAPAPDRAVLFLHASTVVTAPTIRVLAAQASPARFTGPGAPDAPAALVSADQARTLWPVIAAGEPVGVRLMRERGGATLALPAGAVFERVATAGDARRAKTRLLRSLGSPIDTRLDSEFHRRLSRPLTELALSAGVTPNPITITSVIVGLLAAWCVTWATPAGALLGLVVYAAAVVLDHSDGEVARVSFAESALGEWLDITADTVVHSVLVLAMGVATHKVTGTGAVAGIAAAGGVIASAWFAKTSPPASGPLGGMLTALGNRDGYYLMLVLFVVSITAVPTVLPVLMWIVAIGSHAYWVGWLASRIRRPS